MNNIPKISIIIPSYNCDRYIGECLSTLLEQTLSDFEIIIVDDGSTDYTKKVITEFAEKDNRIKLFEQEHKFAGVARNKGLKYANGKYVIFLDSDDFFDKNMLKRCFETAEKDNSDIVLFNADRYNEKTRTIENVPYMLFPEKIYNKRIVTPHEISKTMFQTVSVVPWTKFYRKSFIDTNDVRFSDVHNSNDVFFISVSLTNAKRISVINEYFVHNRRGITTNLQSTKTKNPDNFINERIKLFNYFIDSGKSEYCFSLANEFICAFAAQFNIIDKQLLTEKANYCNRNVIGLNNNIFHYYSPFKTLFFKTFLNENKKKPFILLKILAAISTVIKTIEIYGFKNFKIMFKYKMLF